MSICTSRPSAENSAAKEPSPLKVIAVPFGPDTTSSPFSTVSPKAPNGRDAKTRTSNTRFIHCIRLTQFREENVVMPNLATML